MSAPAIAARGLCVQLGGTRVLHEVDIAIAPGRWTAVVGPNGAGKSTLLKALAQLLDHDGEVRWNGRDAREVTARERALQLAWLGQNEGGAEDLLAQDVVMLGRLPHQGWLGVPGEADRAAVRSAMEQTQCIAWGRRPLGQLSGGERQRVLLARALAVGAPWLLMDEPIANLDPPHQADWLRIVREHVAQGGTAITVLHEITMALHADDLVVIDAGRVVHQGRSSDAGTHAAVQSVFGGAITIHSVAGQWMALPRV